MKSKERAMEFGKWRSRNLKVGIIGVVVALVGFFNALFIGDWYGPHLVIAGVLWYVTFYLRFVIKQREHGTDRLEALRERYYELSGMNSALTAAGQQAAQVNAANAQRIEGLRFRMEELLRRNLKRDIEIATLLTRRFKFAPVNRYATRYRHELINPILSLLRDRVIREGTVIHLLEEPEAFADVVHDRRDELREICPVLIELCKDKWPPPESEAV